jgi:hypothetical protein
MNKINKKSNNTKDSLEDLTKNNMKKKIDYKNNKQIKKQKNRQIYKEKRKKKDKEKIKQTKNEITTNSLNKIIKLENIHKARKEQQMISDKIAFWIFLIISIITNFSLSFLIIFLIVFLQDPLLYFLIAIIGFSFGLFYSYMIHSMRCSLFIYHAYAKIFILLTGIINIIYIISTSTIIYSFLGFKNSIFNFLGVSITYFVFYLIPYFLELLNKIYLEKYKSF